MTNHPAIEGDLLTLIQMAVREDVGSGDKTVELAIPANAQGEGLIVARQPCIVSGLFLLKPILDQYPCDVEVIMHIPDGSTVTISTPIATLRGSVRKILSAERVLLNFLGRMSGISTLTEEYVHAVTVRWSLPTPPPAICDTRKTIPGWRLLDKYAVHCGGGVNHRMGLYDGVMLKDNHLAALRDRLGGGLTLAELTLQVRKELDSKIPLWLEVDTLEQFHDALPGGADVILLDNFSTEQMGEAVALRNAIGSKPLLEASGGITLKNVAEVAGTGVDRISIGALTRSAKVLDLSMEFA